MYLQKSRLLLFHVLFPLLIGGLIYISFRSKALLLFRWFDEIKISGFTNLIRCTLSPMKKYIPNWAIYSLPDGLWVYALSSSLFIIWGKDCLKSFYRVLIIIAFAPCLEIMQFYNILPGTFDIIDLIFYIIASTVSVLIFKLKFKKYEN